MPIGTSSVRASYPSNDGSILGQTMGDLLEELRRWKKAKTEERAQSSGRVAVPMPSGKSDEGTPLPEDSWKQGVVPIRHAEPYRVTLGANVVDNRGNQPNAVSQSRPERAVRAANLVGDTQRAAAARPSTQPATHATHPVTRPTTANFGSDELAGFAIEGAALARESEFRKPAPWVEVGWSLQPPGDGDGGILPVRIGVDFGTAYTKVAIRVAYRVFFVSWDGIHAGPHALFLPGELCSLMDGALWLGRGKEAAAVFSNLKLPFLSGSTPGIQQQALAVAFLAWVMRYARAWVFRELAALLRRRRLAWELNIGCPTNAWGNGLLTSRYKHIACAAWGLSQSEVEISTELAGRALSETTVCPSDVGLDDVHTVPEFVAQIAGYVRSPQRRRGLHLLVDCGAGTLDVVTFNVHRQPNEDHDRFPIFSSAVEPLGTHFLMKERLSTLGPRLAWDDAEQVPSRQTLISRFGVDSLQVEEADKRFASRVRQVVERVIRHTKGRRTPLALAWEQGVPIFLTGGGASANVYRYAVDAACRSVGVKPLYTVFPILEEVNQRGVDRENFHRLSVAFGLTYDAELIGRILAASEVEDFVSTPTKREWPDRDELYPK